MNLKKLIEDSEYFVWLALGDSITEYNHCTEGYENYLQHFDTLLRLAYSKRKYTIINTAVGGSALGVNSILSRSSCAKTKRSE